tara:strand:- start:7057 stop:7521 length:465 start_codon:yes stop_codon:yes gene_type:complete
MKKIFVNWRRALSEKIFNSKEDLLTFLKNNPNQKIHLDNPKGTTKKFGGLKAVVLPFDYGEWPELINPADDMGWDLIIVSSNDKNTENLLPVGEVNYRDEDEIWNKVGKVKPNGVLNNSKIVLAQNGSASEKDKNIINVFFSSLVQFKPVSWYN